MPGDCRGADTAVQTQDWATAQAALPAAQAAAQGRDAKYQVGQLMLRIGIGTTNTQLQAQAIDAMLASGGARRRRDAAALSGSARFRDASRRYRQGRARACAAARAQSQRSNATSSSWRQGQRESNPAGALQLYQRAIQAQEAAGQPVPERMAAADASPSPMPDDCPQAVGLARDLAASTRNPAYWRDALVIYRRARQARSQRRARHLPADARRRRADQRARLRRICRGRQSRRACSARSRRCSRKGSRRNVITAANAGYAREMLTTADRRIAEDRASLAQRAPRGDGRQRRPRPCFGSPTPITAMANMPTRPSSIARRCRRAADANLVNTRLGAALAHGRASAPRPRRRSAPSPAPRAELAQLLAALAVQPDLKPGASGREGRRREPAPLSFRTEIPSLCGAVDTEGGPIPPFRRFRAGVTV